MSLSIPPTDTLRPEWARKVATAINTLLAARNVIQSLAAAPSGPIAGQFYFDTTTNKARVWDGIAWQDLW